MPEIHSNGAGSRNRTCDLALTKGELCQLGYAGERVGPAGFEPAPRANLALRLV